MHIVQTNSINVCLVLFSLGAHLVYLLMCRFLKPFIFKVQLDQVQRQYYYICNYFLDKIQLQTWLLLNIFLLDMNFDKFTIRLHFLLKTTISLNIFLLDMNFDKFTIGLHFLHACKISKKSKIISYVNNQLLKLQVFVV